MSEQVITDHRGRPHTIFVPDATASVPTWLLVSRLWHWYYSSGMTACGETYQYASVCQNFRPHTRNKMWERTITRLCQRCETRLPR